MAVVCVVMNIDDQTIGDLNGRCQFPTKVDESLEGCKFLLSALESGTLHCNVQITVRDTAPAISTSGSGSTQRSYVK